jgi:hypothetical protein
MRKLLARGIGLIGWRRLAGRKRLTMAGAGALLCLTAAAALATSSFSVKPREFDPGRTFLVQAEWLTGIGCPTNARVATSNATGTGVGGFTSYTDPACPTGDSSDRKNTGLLLAKTGPTSNFASAVADIKGVEGKTLTELGYDIRKAGPTTIDPRGSHCGAGAPRFNIETTVDSYFLGCNSPPPTSQLPDGDGFIRLTWGGSSGPLIAFGSMGLAPVAGKVESLSIVFDEGTDPSGGPDQFGLAVLDNINVNGVRVGRGPGDGDDDDDDEHDDDGDKPKDCDRCDDDD